MTVSCEARISLPKHLVIVHGHSIDLGANRKMTVDSGADHESGFQRAV
jgi:hypothetical protein